jgi:uncharacterized protein (DUF983 family)
MNVGVVRAVARAAGLRCPSCGTRWHRSGRVALAPSCASCRLRLDRGETDYFLGSYTISLFGALVGAVAVAVASLLVPAHSMLVAAAGIPMIALWAVWLHPRSRLLWLAADLQFRPACAEDYVAATDSREATP